MPVLDARYELGHRIGGGGMAEVVEAYDRKLDRRVAVKILRVGINDPLARERFIREARMAAGFVHPNVVTIYDVGQTRGRPYLVMEIVDGSTLATVIARRGALPVGEALAISDAVLAALSAAHRGGLVHRDVKPANILIGDDGRVKLADFGIAKATQNRGADLTATGQVLGTAGYLAPEQVGGADATPTSDIYAAGVVLYEMLAGQPPFTGEHPVAVALAHQRSRVPPLSERRPGISAPIAAAVSRALEKDPAQRFQDASEMRAALTAAGADAAAGGGPSGRAASTVPLSLPPTPTAVRPVVDPAPEEPSVNGGGSRRGLVVAAVAGAVIGALALGAVLLAHGDGSNPDAQGAALRSTTTTTLPATTTTTTTATQPRTTPTTLPQTVDQLIALMATDPSAWGARGQDLFDALVAVSQQPDRNGRDATRLIAEIQRWVSRGELAPAIGALAEQLVAPLASVSNSGQGGGKGHRD